MPKRKLFVVFALTALACSLVVPSFADSQARIVRLSQVDGDVQIDRNAGQGYEKAFINLPVIQGSKLRAGQGARAEIEFEDGSTLRITPETEIEFPELALRDSGARASSVNLLEGTAYLNFKGGKEEEFSLGFGQKKIELGKAAHLRIELRDADATVAVFKGDVEVDDGSGKVKVDKKHSATFDLASAERYTLASNLEPDPYDDWDKQQEKYHQRYYSSAASNSFSPYAYGVSDLNYYGSFYNMPGYGMMWQPYLVGAGWDPFMNGAWTWYPGAGYTWVSAYPWGWTPYRYGAWTFVSGAGWFWQPGRSWAGWNTGPRITNPPRQFSFPRPPATPGRTLLVNRGIAAGPVRVTQNRTEIRTGSAGLGVARGSVRNLGKVSQQVGRSAPSGATVRSPMGTSAARFPAGTSRVSSPRSGAQQRSAPAAGGGSQRMGGEARSAPSSHGGTPHR